MKRVLMRSGYAEMLADGAETELWVYGDIGDSWFGEESVTAKAVADTLSAVTGGTLTVRVNSYGGVVADGIAIHNAVRRCKAATKRVEIDGVAMSSASLIAMAADPGQCRIAANALLMIHAPWGHAIGNAQDMRANADMLDRYASAMASSYARGQVSEADALALLTDGQDHYYTAAEAVAAGFCDEVSVEALPIAASANASTLRTAALARYRTNPAPTAGVKPTGDTSMPEKTVPPAATVTAHTDAPAPAIPLVWLGATGDSKPDEATERTRAQAAITAHIGALDQAFAPLMGDAYPHADLVRAEVDRARIDLSATPDQVRARVMARLGELTMQPLAAPSYSRATAGEDESDKRRAAASAWLMVRAGVRTLRQADGTDKPLSIDANPFRGFGLMDIARACLRAAGKNPDGMDKLAIVAMAFQTTSDFPVLLENTLNKTLLNAYRIQTDTWGQFCRQGSVTDFRAHNRYRTGSLGNLESKNEAGEFRRLTIPDGEKASITAGTKGNIIAITRETIINDDMGALMDIASSLGRAAKRTIESDVYAMLGLNSGCGPTMSDTYALFSSEHGNRITTGKGAPTVTTIADMRNAMRKQKDVGGNDYLDIMPDIWLGPLTDSDAARVVNGSTYDPDTANKLQRNNPVLGIFRAIVDSPRIATRQWYTFANPNDAPVFEVAFLDGQMEPYTETQNGWSVDGAEIKARLDYGIAAIDYRGACLNDGA